MFKKKKDVVDDIARVSEWYMGPAGVEAVKSKLTGQPEGTFAVRDSTSQPGNYVLTYSHGGGIKNVHIDGESGVVKLAKSSVTFKTITELVMHYSENETAEIPCKLVGSFLSAEDAKTLKKQSKTMKSQRAPAARAATVKKGKGAPGSVWKQSDVCDWLKSMDMPEYVPTFKKNKIDGVALLDLTDADLRELGVGAAGQRKKLVTAIENLNIKFKAMNEGPAAPQGPNVAPEPAANPVSTVGLIARNIDGVVKIFDVETGEEVQDIAAHQARREQARAAAASNGGGGGDVPVAAPPPARKAPEFRLNEHEEKMWFDRRLAKARIQPLLEGGPEGNFVVRDSSSNPGCFAFSYLADGKIQHKLIEESDGGFHFKACEEMFPTICNLIYHYTMTPGLALKCCLVYPTNRVRDSANESDAASGSGPPTPAKSAAKQAWDAMDLEKSAALAKINGKPPGSFVIRASDKAYAAISVVRPDGSLFHQHIEEVPGGLQLKKSTAVHADLSAFVSHYSQQSQGDLPCPLVH